MRIRIGRCSPTLGPRCAAERGGKPKHFRAQIRASQRQMSAATDPARPFCAAKTPSTPITACFGAGPRASPTATDRAAALRGSAHTAKPRDASAVGIRVQHPGLNGARRRCSSELGGRLTVRLQTPDLRLGFESLPPSHKPKVGITGSSAGLKQECAPRFRRGPKRPARSLPAGDRPGLVSKRSHPFPLPGSAPDRPSWRSPSSPRWARACP